MLLLELSLPAHLLHEGHQLIQIRLDLGHVFIEVVHNFECSLSFRHTKSLIPLYYLLVLCQFAHLLMHSLHGYNLLAFGHKLGISLRCGYLTR